MVSNEGTVTISDSGNTPSEGQNRLIFSQVANGTLDTDVLCGHRQAYE